MIQLPSSLRNRLVAAAVAVGLTFAALFGAGATWRVEHAQNQAVRAALESRIELARDQVGADGSINQDAGSPKTDLVQVIGPDGQIRASSPGLVGVRPLVSVAAVRSSPGGLETRLALQHPDTDLEVLAVPLRIADTAGSPAGAGALVVAVDVEGFNAATTDLLGLLLAGLAAVVLAMAALAWILTGRALVSVTRITETAEAVRPQDLAAGLPVPPRDAELARLVEALNRMLARLHQSHAAELAFAADAGHRLRTPVATLRAEAELALREKDPSELAAALERVVRDADQLTSIVDRMLARSRALGRGPQPVVELLYDASSRWHRQAELAKVILRLRTDERITPETSCAELDQIVEPLLDNAVRHTPEGGLVDVDVYLDGRCGETLVVSVSNTGDPVASDIAPHLFDAWVSSRDASVAGGLGLWLARETAREVGGEVDLVEDDRYAATFQARLPATPSSSSRQRGVTGTVASADRPPIEP